MKGLSSESLKAETSAASSTSASSISEKASSRPHTSVCFTVVDFDGCTPLFICLHATFGSPVRIVVSWPVGRLPSTNGISSRMSFVLFIISTIAGMRPFGSFLVAQSISVRKSLLIVAIEKPPYFFSSAAPP